ncbi:unnamed protein product [Lepeophtheirus salmonis]|uniref:(salmon louse) hypothetical protein n=1 Tax=Lepeophtheirus salmonis TaxID=72036 RepID=A0A7R8CK60_LEPSM|nr:unnamed protein product [Lepeophtheirus salmonis]CAF2846616.1 unnamed protein product [Lepeophtheirus salmonis]
MADEEYNPGKYSMSSSENEYNNDYKEQHYEMPQLISTNVEEDNITNSNEENLKAPDGTQWFEIPLEVSHTVGRFRTHNVLTKSPSPTCQKKCRLWNNDEYIFIIY